MFIKSFATTRPSGEPHVVPVWFHWDGTDMLVLANPKSQKARNLRANPHVSVAVDESRYGYESVVLDGVAILESKMAPQSRLDQYLLKYAMMIPEIEFTVDEMLRTYSQAIRIRPIRFVPLD